MLFGRKKRRISRLLLVEDEPLVAFDTEHLLRDAEFEIVATVDRVADAIAVIGANPDRIDLVLVDPQYTASLARDLLAAIAAIDAVLEGKPPRRLPSGFSLFATAA